jgi:exosortase J
MVAVATVCAAAGLLSVYGSVRALVDIWMTDDLKSMGLVVPLVSYLLVLRSWRQIGWSSEGASWWGFALLAGSAAMMFVRDQMLLIVTVNRDWLLQLPPLPLMAVVYAAGMVLLFGGTRLLRQAWFPVLFMWMVIPVPQTFSRRVDLPLQHASASVARAFAHALGQPLTQDKLRLMFTPDFGMFIAPGCNGIRGAITLGLAAVVVGYLYRFRWFVFAPVVAGAILLAYLFNFVRLCLLVVYYKLALPFPWMQHHAKIADYVIGGCLFVCALAVFFTVADGLRQRPQDVAPEVPAQPAEPARPAPLLLRAVAVLAMAAVFGVDVLHERQVDAAAQATAQPQPPLPAQIGRYRLVRSWNDTLLDGIVVYHWGEYVAPGGPAGTDGVHISLGISPEMGVHDAEVCHIARGEDPTWHGQIESPSASGTVALTAATYNDGITQRLEASTVCDKGSCGQYSQDFGRPGQHISLVYARPHRGAPLEPDATRPVPVLLKVESQDVLAPVGAAEQEMAATVTAFLKDADLVGITAPYARR